jgi:6-pyruvoyltetrahydropterin/6-carboxytetrahydropterin synthase|tara:strand:+ start:142682 stop:143197 length:516 start_codon:yes stop_codon:yes gene_type:complete
VNQLTTIELSKEYLKFSSGHFTIFSATERERLHGHNFAVSASIVAPVGDNGLCFSYGEFKTKLQSLCEALDEFMILPGLSPHLKISESEFEYLVNFNNEQMRFLVSDTLVLPIRNATVEEFASYLLSQLIEDSDIKTYGVQQIGIKVSSGPGQWGSCQWSVNSENRDSSDG